MLRHLVKQVKQVKQVKHTRTMSTVSQFHKNLVFNHTCLRIKDPKVTIPFYEQNFGFKLIHKQPFPDLKFDLYFVSYNNAPGSPFNRPGVLELTHNYGTENDPEFKVNNGNGETHRGFGHICVSVDNIEQASSELEAKGVKFQKRLTDGRQKNIAFALDPDGYWIELIEHGVGKTEAKTSCNHSKFNHTMIRVKDPAKSLKFYREVLGLKLLSTSVHEGAKFTLYFLGYQPEEFTENGLSKQEQAKLESVLELTHNWGTENEDGQIYHNGNDQPQGYGHIGISSDDAAGFCKALEETFGDELTWSLKFGAGKLKEIAFLRDPDNYYIEILPKELTF